MAPNLNAVSQDFASYAIDFFLTSYVLIPYPSPVVSRGFWRCIYPIWLETKPTSPLRPALAAVASCLLEAWSLLIPDAPLAFSRMQNLEAVAALRKSLQNTDGDGDDVLLAALLLDMYENLRGFLWSRPVSSTHTSGIIAMVEHRRRSPVVSKSPLSQRLILGARNQVVGRAMNNVHPLPSNVFAWASSAPDVPNTTAFQLDELDIQLANIQGLTSQLDTSAAEGQHVSAWEVLKIAYETDQQYVAWARKISTVPVSVSGPECIPPSVKEAGIYQDCCHVYENIHIAYAFNCYRSSRIKLQLAILTCLSQLGNSIGCIDGSLAAHEVIQDLVDEMCASVPFHLGDRTIIGRIDDKTVQYPHIAGSPVPDEHYIGAAAMGGWFLATRLGELLALKLPLRDGQRQWIGQQLRRVMKIYAVQPPAPSRVEAQCNAR